MPLKARILIYILSCLLVSKTSYSQTDTEFWFAPPAITPAHENTPIVFRITSYDKAASITITEPSNANFVPIVLNTSAFTTITYDVTSLIGSIESKPSAAILNTGIKITATANISVYYEVGQQKNPEIFPLKGISAKGLSFVVPSQMTYNNQVNLNPPANNGFVIVATEDNTTIDINLSKPDGNGHLAGVFTITLNKGQTYAVIGSSNQAALHLGGSTITSNKPICVTIYDDSILVGTSWDLAGDQIVPIVNTGTEFIVVRGALNAPSYSNSDLYYVWATEDNTVIYLNGSTSPIATINKGNYYSGVLSSNSIYITTTHPAYVLQFTGTGTEVAETSLPSIKCTGSNIVSFVRSTTENFFLNIICKKADVDYFSINGNTNIINSSLFELVPGTVDWMAARINISNLPNLNTLIPANQATTISNSNGLFHLGFLNGGNLSGSRLGYFSNYSKVAMAPNLTTSSCLGGNIQLAARKLNNVEYVWSGPNNFSSHLYNPTINNATLQDSGYYYVQATIPGCGTSIDSVFISIHALPSIQFTKSLDTVCYGSAKNIGFTLTGQSPWNIVYTDGIIKDTVKHVVKSDSSFTVKPLQQKVYQILSIVDSNSCDINNQISVIYDTIVVNKLPVAKFNVSDVHCEKMKITFTDQSTADLDHLTKWFWDFGNNDTINVLYNASIDRVFPVAGVDTVKLVVRSSMGCNSDTVRTPISILHLPKVGFVIPNVCLDGGMANFKDTSQYPYFPTSFTYSWNFNAGLNPISPGPTYTLNQTTQAQPSVLYNSGGAYQVSLKVTTAEGCVDTLTKVFTINGSNPTAVFKVLKDTALCSNQSVVIQDSSWVYPGQVGLLHIYWGDGMDTIVDHSIINTKYQHFYSLNSNASNLNYTIKVKAFSGGTCLDSVVKNINIVPPPLKVQLATTQDYLCINDSSLVSHRITGGLPPFAIQLETNNNNASTKGDFVYGLSNGIVTLGTTLKDAKQCIYVFPNLLTLNLPVLPIAKLYVKDTVICNGDSVQLKGTGASIYKWYQGSTLIKSTLIDSIGIFSPGSYSLVVNDGKCNSMPSKSISIIDFNIPTFSFSTNSIACTNGYLSINTNAVEKYKIHFYWNFGDSTSSFLPAPPSHNYTKIGTYQIQLHVTNDYCPQYEYSLLGDTIQVINPLKSNDFTLFVLSGIDTLLSPLKIDSGYTNYSWSPFIQLSNSLSARPIFNGTESIKYTLLREDPNSGCRIYDIYNINVSSDVIVNVPKAFTPNNDNLNDRLKIEHGAGIKQLNYFNIYNRWGKLLFSTNNITEGWNGTFENEPQLMDQYNFIVDYITYKEEHVKKTGSFILIR